VVIPSAHWHMSSLHSLYIAPSPRLGWKYFVQRASGNETCDLFPGKCVIVTIFAEKKRPNEDYSKALLMTKSMNRLFFRIWNWEINGHVNLRALF